MKNDQKIVIKDIKTRILLYVAFLINVRYIVWLIVFIFQFLKWELPVPEIHEFTFCLWVKSTDLTYPHSILSYSSEYSSMKSRFDIAPLISSLCIFLQYMNFLYQLQSEIQFNKFQKIRQVLREHERVAYCFSTVLQFLRLQFAHCK